MAETDKDTISRHNPTLRSRPNIPRASRSKRRRQHCEATITSLDWSAPPLAWERCLFLLSANLILRRTLPTSNPDLPNLILHPSTISDFDRELAPCCCSLPTICNLLSLHSRRSNSKYFAPSPLRSSIARLRYSRGYLDNAEANLEQVESWIRTQQVIVLGHQQVDINCVDCCFFCATITPILGGILTHTSIS